MTDLDRLCDDQIKALADAFPDRESACLLLTKAGLSPGLHPAWSATSGWQFWSAVSELFANGILADGPTRLLAAACSDFPDNSVFCARSGKNGPRDWPLVWNVPPCPVRLVGRDSLLAAVHESLRASNLVALVALEGMGGVGKTALAIRYAYRYQSEFEVVWWVAADQADAVATNISALAAPLGLTPDSDAASVWSVLSRRQSWLVIFDNVEDLDAVARFRPSGGGQVLLTSRRTGMDALGVALTVPTLARSDAARLLALRVRDIEPDLAERIVALLGDLPLAVEQAAGYLTTTRTPPAEYLKLLEKYFNRMIAKGRVAGLWEISVDRLRKENPASVELLELAALCDAAPIPLDLFSPSRGRLGGSPLADVAEDPVAWADTVGALVGYSLARREGGSIAVHRLIGAVTRLAMTNGLRARLLETLVGLFRDAMPVDLVRNPPSWPPARRILPHLVATLGYLGETPEHLAADVSWCRVQAAAYLMEHGQVPTAVPLLRRAADDRETFLGPDHPDTLASRHHLADAYRRSGRLDDAISLFEANLADRSRVLGTDHRDTIDSRHHVGIVYQQSRRVHEAVRIYERTLAQAERILGVDDPVSLSTRNSLAYGYTWIGRLDEAIELYESTLTDAERTLGADHPDSLRWRNNLAHVYQVAGRLDESLPLFDAVLRDRRRVLGEDHPETLRSSNNLASAHQAAGHLDEATRIFGATLAAHSRVLGEDHLETLISQNNLAHVHQTAGRLDSAIPLFEATLAGRRRILGNDHPDTIASHSNVGRAYELAGRPTEAMEIYEKSLEQGTRVLDKDHPLLAVLRDNIASARRPQVGG
ncbi:tetratricopeptide repeat protein [Pseudofrankia saprophytica]|uniref:tetratricopeptide repeat protein n=1 Tax=Pseudofrankia saprophytica TaxID=298655 RepID=UPI000234C888|nr:tetratricopeptide repeat protein [Pseudofrankia saprophytica]